MYIILLGQGSESPALSPGKTGILLDWCGYEWQVKIKEHPAGPGPNIFGLHPENVKVLRSGALKLSVLPMAEGWSCAEIFTTKLLRNGLYVFEVGSEAQKLHPQLVAGFFTYNETREHHYNESDIEISRWGLQNNKNAQFAHYADYDIPEVYRFDLSPMSNLHTFIIHKTQGEVAFYYLDRKYSLKIPTLKEAKAFYRFSNTTHHPDYFRIHINLWLFEGAEPAERIQKDELQLTINRFRYLPE